MTTSEQLAALDWCRAHNARVRFESDGTVSVFANGYKRRRPTFVEAVTALDEKLSPRTVSE